MDNLKSATIDRLLELAPARTFEISGYTYIDKDKHAELFVPPAPHALQITTLTGLVELLEENFETYRAFAPVLVHVASEDSVQLIAALSDMFGRRRVFVDVKRVAAARSFKFNQYMPQEDFIIGLRSMFLQELALDDLVAVAGNLAAQSELKQQDDGFTQQATVKAGVVRLTEKVINPRVKLTPFRTFLEAVQPSSEYIFRIKGANECALFDADAGNWKLQAIQNARTWLLNRLHGSPVAEVNSIPVIA